MHRLMHKNSEMGQGHLKKKPEVFYGSTKRRKNRVGTDCELKESQHGKNIKKEKKVKQAEDTTAG